MPAQDDNQLHPLEDMKTGFHLLLIVAHTYAFSVKVFLHTGMGRRAFGRTALLVPILIPLHMAACAEFNVAPLGWFWCAYLTMCVYHGLQLGRRMSQGRANDVHTYYDGETRLRRWLPFFPEETVKETVEPWFLFVVAFAVAIWNGPLASYLAVSGFCLALTYGLEKDALRQADDDLHDQLHEARWRAERFRRDAE